MTSYTPDTTDTAYTLANLAGTLDPDGLDTAGARWLTGVRDDLAERVGYDSFDRDDVHEIADGAVEIYTGARWAVFTDLCMWRVDTDELRGDEQDMTKLAGIAQYVAAEQLCYALLERWEGEGSSTCRHCERTIEQDTDGAWIDPDATGDDAMWRETCDENDTSREAGHEIRES